MTKFANRPTRVRDHARLGANTIGHNDSGERDSARPAAGITMTGSGKALHGAIENELTVANRSHEMSQPPKLLRVITKAELRRIVPYTPQHILRLEKRGLFPRRVRLGANRVGWLLAE